MKKLVSGIRTARDSRRIAVMARMAEDHFRGPEGLARAWRRHLRAACLLPDGHRQACNLLCAVARLGVAAHELNPMPDPGFDRMNDDELHQALDGLLAQKLAESLPEIVEELVRLGWRVEPPNLNADATELCV